MLKGILCIAVIGLCGYIGTLLSKKYLEHLCFLRELLGSVTGMRNRILHGELLHRAIGREARGNQNLLGIADQLVQNPRIKVSTAWEEAFIKLNDPAVTALGRGIESLCTSGNAAELDEGILLLTNRIRQMEDEKRGKTKGYLSVSVLIGIFVGVLFI